MPERRSLNNTSRYAAVKMRLFRGTEMLTTVKRLLPMAFVLMGICGSAWAQQATNANNGLGQAWPNAPDVSSSPRWHVYVFQRDGVRYIQVNDLNGTVRGAFATANGEYMALPIGTGTLRVDAAQQPPTASPSAPSETVYRDNAMQLQLTPQSNGNVLMRAQETCGDPANCTGGHAM